MLVWGAIKHDGPAALKIFDERIDSEVYLDVLKNKVRKIDGLKEGKLKYQHDNWAVHRAGIVRQYLEKQPYETIDWPSHSPDLNPIENVWGLLKDRVWEKAHEIESKGDLIKLIEQTFWHDEMIKVAIKRCYQSMPYRINQVIERNGQSCGY